MLNGKRVKKYKTSVQMANLNPYWNTSFKIAVNPQEIQSIELQVLNDFLFKEQQKYQKIIISQIFVNDFDKFGGNDTIGWLNFSLKDTTSAGKLNLKNNYYFLLCNFYQKKNIGIHWREAISQPKTNITKWHALQPFEEDK